MSEWSSRSCLPCPSTELKDLHARLRATRWPDRETDERQGLALEDLQGPRSDWAQEGTTGGGVSGA